MKTSLFEHQLKTIGMIALDTDSLGSVNGDTYSAYIKVLYLNEGFEIKVDFNVYTTNGPTLFFIGPNQVLQILKVGEQPGRLLF